MFFSFQSKLQKYVFEIMIWYKITIGELITKENNEWIYLIELSSEDWGLFYNDQFI